MVAHDELLAKFQAIFGNAPGTRMFHAPGRVNLIGEHIDYNGGHVFPAALTFGTTMVIRPRADRQIRFASTQFPKQAEISLDDIIYRSEDDWINYPKGMLAHLMKKGYRFNGYDVLYHGEIPNGAGLSSSASIEVVTGFGFLMMEGHPVDSPDEKVNIALVAQEAENQFIGVNCGIMDQFAVSLGLKDHAILLKCNTLEYDHVPFQARGYKIVIGNTNKRRGLVDSEYNDRRAQCAEAVQDLQVKYPTLQFLCELTADQLDESAELIRDPVVMKRARHVIEENDRVLASVTALQNDDLARFGELMIASHVSLRDLYEVSCRELDVLVEEALRIEGVLGSRMTGAGFGGCTVSLVKEDQVARFREEVGSRYKERTGLTAEFYTADIGDGVNMID